MHANDRSSGTDHRGVERLVDLLLLVAASLVSTYLIANLLAFPHGRDHGIYAVVADAILAGKAPYLAAWDFKPPGIYFVFALSEMLFGSSTHAIRLLETIGLVSLAGAFVLLSRRCATGAGAGLVAARVAVTGYVELEFWHTAQPESFGGIALA